MPYIVFGDSISDFDNMSGPKIAIMDFLSEKLHFSRGCSKVDKEDCLFYLFFLS